MHGDVHSPDSLHSEPPTILVVDDDFHIQGILQHWLERAGFRVTLCNDGDAALRVLDDTSVDLVLLDQRLPGSSGLDTLRTLRLKYSARELPVIMATADGNSASVVTALESGANDYIVKPFDFPVALARICTQLKIKDPGSSAPLSIDVAIEEGRSLVGSVLGQRYEIVSFIGAGGFSDVYRCRHAQLDRFVALKVLRKDVLTRLRDLRRFQQEAVIVSQVDHPNAVRIFDADFTGDGNPFLVMELLTGDTLASELARKKRLAPRRCAEILLPVCDVLARAHALGIIHRDLKPSNVFLHHQEATEIVKVLDFGLATWMGRIRSDPQEGLTSTGELLGTPTYMAPERLRDLPCDGRADVYSLGIMLYQMLTGRVPFTASDRDPLLVAMKHVNEEPETPRTIDPGIPSELEDVVLDALEKNPVNRPTARELAELLAVATKTQAPAADDPAWTPTRR